MTTPDYVVELDVDRDGTFSLDATNDVRSGSLSRGVSSLSGPFARANAATALVRLSNGTAAYDPREVTGLAPRHRWRIFGPTHDVDCFVHLPGVDSIGTFDDAYLSTPHAAGLVASGDLDLRVRAVLPDAIDPDAGLSWRLAGKGRSWDWEASATELELHVRYGAGVLDFATFTLTVPVPVGADLWYRVTLDLSNGANSVATFQWSTDGSSWTTLGTATQAIIASIYDADSLPLYLGARERTAGTVQATTSPFDLLGANLADAGGTFANVDLTGLARRATSTTDASGNVWTLQGSAITVGGTGRPLLFTGRSPGVKLEYPVGGKDAVAGLAGVDGHEELSGAHIAEPGPSVAAQPTYARMNAGLTEAGWSGGRILAPGLQRHSGGYTGNVWNLLQLDADSAGGELWVDAEGRVVFRERAGHLAPYWRTVALELADDGTGVGYQPITDVTIDDARRVTTALLTSINSSTQQTAEDATSAADGAYRAVERSDLTPTFDDDVERLARHLVGSFATPLPRFGRVAIDVHGLSTANAAAVLALDLGYRVQVTHDAPGAAAPYVTEQIVRGITDTWDEESGVWVRTLTLEDAEHYDRWILGDATLGLLGSTTRLA